MMTSWASICKNYVSHGFATQIPHLVFFGLLYSYITSTKHLAVLSNVVKPFTALHI